jgi:hypothetical protein
VLTRPYRFGIFFGITNALAGLFYGWLAVISGSVPGTIALGLSALFSIATGIGLLRKRNFGLVLMDLMFFLVVVEAITDWFKPHQNLVYYICMNIAIFAAMFAILRYFYKRQYEFS